MLDADQNHYISCGVSSGSTLGLAVAYPLLTMGHRNWIIGSIGMVPFCIHPNAVSKEYKPYTHKSKIHNRQWFRALFKVVFDFAIMCILKLGR